MTKDFAELEDLFHDLEKAIFRTETHSFLFRIFPPEEGKMVLEPGCGSGKLGLAYAMGGCEVVLFDINYEAVAYARKLRGALNSLIGFPLPVQIKVGNIHRMHFADNTFDLVFNEGVVQQWADEGKCQGAIDQMARVSRDTVVVMANNRLYRSSSSDSVFDYSKCPTSEELEIRLKRAGLKRVQVESVTPGEPEDSILIAGYGRKS